MYTYISILQYVCYIYFLYYTLFDNRILHFTFLVIVKIKYSHNDTLLQIVTNRNYFLVKYILQNQSNAYYITDNNIYNHK